MSPHEHQLTRRSALGLGLGAAATLALAGCGSGSGGGTNASGGTLTKLPKYIRPPKVDGGIYSDVNGVPPGYATLPEKLFASTDAPWHGVKPVSVLQIVWGNPPSKLSDNEYWHVLNQGLGTEYAGVFVPFDAYDAKVATTLASGDMPDVMELVPSATSEKAIRQGAFADLTDVLAGDGIEKYRNLAAIRPDQWKNSSVNGRIYGVPVDLPLFDMQWMYRSDWAAKLGHPDPPTTPDEFLAVMTAISKGRPAGKQVYGIGCYGGSFGGAITIFLNAMFRVPNEWRLNKDGSLTNAIDTDEYEQAVAFTRKLWKAGAFHPDAIALGDQGAKALNMYLNDQIGFIKGGIAGGTKPPYVNKSGSTMLVPPGDGGKGFAVPRSSGWYARSVIPAKVAKDEKRLHEVLSVIDYLWAPYGSKELAIVWWGKQGSTYDVKHGIPEVRTSGKYANDVTGFSAWTAPFFYQSPEGRAPIQRAVSYCEKMVKSSVANPCANIFSPTQNRLDAQMTNLQQDYVNQIVTGRRPMSDLKKYRSEWHKRGGDQMMREYRKGLEDSGS